MSHLHVVAPHAEPGGAVAAGLVLAAGDRALCGRVLGHARAALLARVDPHRALLLLALLLRVPPAPAEQV